MLYVMILTLNMIFTFVLKNTCDVPCMFSRLWVGYLPRYFFLLLFQILADMEIVCLSLLFYSFRIEFFFKFLFTAITDCNFCEYHVLSIALSDISKLHILLYQCVKSSYLDLILMEFFIYNDIYTSPYM
jgi:hypothetical protein